MLRALRCLGRPIEAKRKYASSIPRLATAASLPADIPLETPNLGGKRLRAYQEECIQSVLSYLGKGHKRLGISLATGSGKTVIFTHLIDRIISPRPDATQTLILVHRRELVEQAARHCAEVYPTKSVEIEMGNLHASGRADITIASIMSIISGDRISKFDPRSFKLILVDEAHHIVAKGYMNTLRYFGLLGTTQESPALVGVSATLSRFDGLKLGAAIDHIVYHRDYVDMIEEKWLSNVIFTTVQSKADVSKVKKGTNGDFQASDLSRAINTAQTNEITVRAWLARANGRKSTLVFCADLEHISGLVDMFRRHGVEAHFITGDTPKTVRSKKLDEFRRSEFPVLLNCGVFTEGTDIPNIDCVLLARPTKSRNLLVQMIGRGMRLHPGKENCHIIDMVASLETGIVTTPTLFGLDPSEVLKEVDLEKVKELRERKELEAQREENLSRVATARTVEPARRNRKITFTDYDSVYDLIEDTAGDRHIRRLSLLAWVNVAQSRWILSMQGGDYLTIDIPVPPENLEEGDGVVYRVRFTQKLPSGEKFSKSPYMRPREIATMPDFEGAIRAADTFAMERYSYNQLSHAQAWRKQPASPAQLLFLNKIRDMHNQLTGDTITKGKAGDMITKLKFGAKQRFKALESTKKMQEKASVRKVQLQEMRNREEVRVGPLAAL